MKWQRIEDDLFISEVREVPEGWLFRHYCKDTPGRVQVLILNDPDHVMRKSYYFDDGIHDADTLIGSFRIGPGSET